MISSELTILETRRESQQIAIDTLVTTIERLEAERELTEEQQEQLETARSNRDLALQAERDIEASISNKRNEIAANNLSLLNETELAAGRYAASLELVNSQLKIYEKLTQAVSDFNTDVTTYNRIIRGTNTRLLAVATSRALSAL